MGTFGGWTLHSQSSLAAVESWTSPAATLDRPALVFLGYRTAQTVDPAVTWGGVAMVKVADLNQRAFVFKLVDAPAGAVTVEVTSNNTGGAFNFYAGYSPDTDDVLQAKAVRVAGDAGSWSATYDAATQIDSLNVWFITTTDSMPAAGNQYDSHLYAGAGATEEDENTAGGGAGRVASVLVSADTSGTGAADAASTNLTFSIDADSDVNGILLELGDAGPTDAEGAGVFDGEALLAGTGAHPGIGAGVLDGEAILVGTGQATGGPDADAAGVLEAEALLVGTGTPEGGEVTAQAILVAEAILLGRGSVPSRYPGKWQFRGIDFRVELGVGSGYGGTGGIWDDPGSAWDDPGTVWGGSEPTYINVTRYARRIKTKRGRKTRVSRFDTGSAVLTIDNREGNFSPGSGVPGPGNLELRPGRAVRISATTGLGWVPLWQGQIEDMPQEFASAGWSPYVTFRAIDAMGSFANINEPASPLQGAGELSGARMTRILDFIGWADTAARRRIDPGLNTLQATTLAQPIGNELGITSDSEDGALFIDGNGAVVFRQQDWLTTDPRSTSIQLTVGGPGSNMRYVSPVRVNRSRKNIRNDIQLSRAGGTLQRRQDGASQTLFDRRTHRRLDLINDNDPAVGVIADRLLAALAADRDRVDRLTIRPAFDDQAERAIRLEFGDLIRADIGAVGGSWRLTQDAHLMGIEWDIRTVNGAYAATLLLDPSEAP